MAAILDLVIKGLFIEIAEKVVVGVLNGSPQLVPHFSCVARGALHLFRVQMSLVTLMGHLILVDV